MAWLLAALAAAFCVATADALTKQVLRRNNEYVVAWLLQLFGLPVLWALFLLNPIPHPPAEFWLTVAVALPIEVGATLLYIKALKVSPLSLTLPFLSLTPLFLIVVPYVFLGETISGAGLGGVVLITAGGYVLNIRDFRHGWFRPFLSIGREKGSVFMIVVAFLYSFTSTLGKKAIGLSGAAYFLAVYCSLLTFCLTPFALRRLDAEARTRLPELGRAVLLPGVFATMTIIATALALKLGPVAYAVSVKRLNLLLGILYGHIIFRETNIRDRFLGTLLMLLGFILIVLNV